MPDGFAIVGSESCPFDSRLNSSLEARAESYREWKPVRYSTLRSTPQGHLVLDSIVSKYRIVIEVENTGTFENFSRTNSWPLEPARRISLSVLPSPSSLRCAFHFRRSSLIPPLPEPAKTNQPEGEGGIAHALDAEFCHAVELAHGALEAFVGSACRRSEDPSAGDAAIPPAPSPLSIWRSREARC